MTTMLLYLVLAVPKQNCKDIIKNSRADAAVKLAEISKSTSSGPAFEIARDNLGKVPADPQASFEWLVTPPAKDRYGVCFDVFAKKVELELVK